MLGRGVPATVLLARVSKSDRQPMSNDEGKVPLSKIARYKTNSEIECKQDQQVKRLAVHAFRWSQKTAWCTCRGWKLWPCSEANGKTNHDHHVRNLPSSGSVGHEGTIG
jgi:hypothetical protein